MQQFADAVTLVFTDVLLWIGFGTVVGLIAKAAMPGKDPGGTLATVFVGVVGCIIGAATWFYITGRRVAPISIAGLLVGCAGAALLLFTYRALNGNILKRGFGVKEKRGRRRISVVEDE